MHAIQEYKTSINRPQIVNKKLFKINFNSSGKMNTNTSGKWIDIHIYIIYNRFFGIGIINCIATNTIQSFFFSLVIRSL